MAAQQQQHQHRVIRVSAEDVHAASLAWAEPYVDWHPNARFFSAPSGEHYKLLATIAAQLSGARIVDIGTYLGHSAMALASRAQELGNTVDTYDVQDCLFVDDAANASNGKRRPERCARDHPAVRQLIRNASDDIADIAASARIVLLDVTPHDGVQERAMIADLVKHGFRGVLILDDVKLNKDMEALWAWVPAPKKIDATDLGHWSGTGIAVFDPAWIDVELVRTVPVSATAPGGGKLL